MLSSVRNVFRIPDLRGKILFTLLIIGLYRIGAFTPAPGIDLDADAGWRAAHGQSVPGEPPDGAEGEVLLVDADGPVAIAEPREGALLKPIVGFRE